MRLASAIFDGPDDRPAAVDARADIAVGGFAGSSSSGDVHAPSGVEAASATRPAGGRIPELRRNSASGRMIIRTPAGGQTGSIS
jgi:hypothetical protein